LEVAPGGLCGIAGIKPGDILTKIDSYDVQGFDIERIVAYVKLRRGQGAAVKAILLRGGQSKAIEVQL
jgi:C-terminal processing protease CtpA/Prc